VSERAASLRRLGNDAFFGRRLRELRIECGLSQEDVARGVGLTRQAVGEHERGLRPIEPARLVQYGQFLAVNLSRFVSVTRSIGATSPRADEDRSNDNHNQI
jgi:transcriptional regulator with XRE-family HTH domain